MFYTTNSNESHDANLSGFRSLLNLLISALMKITASLSRQISLLLETRFNNLWIVAFNQILNLQI